MVLTINGKDFPLHWGLGALEMFCDAMECDLNEGLDIALNVSVAKVKGQDQHKYIVNLILAAIKNGADAEHFSDDVGVSYRQLQKFLDDAPANTLSDILDDFAKSRIFGRTIAEYLFGSEPEEQESEKKSPSDG